MACQKLVAILVVFFCFSFLHLNISEATRLGPLVSVPQHKIIQEKQDVKIFTHALAPYNDIIRRVLKGGRGGRSGRGGGGYIFPRGSHSGSSNNTPRKSLAFLLLCALNVFITLAS